MNFSYSERKMLFDTFIDFWDKFTHFTEDTYSDDKFNYKQLFCNGKMFAVLKRPIAQDKSNPYIELKTINEIEYKWFFRYMFHKRNVKKSEPTTYLEKLARFVLEVIEKEYRECESYVVGSKNALDVYEHKFSKFTIEHCVDVKIDGVLLNLGLCNKDYVEIIEYLKSLEYRELKNRMERNERKEENKWKEICKKYDIE